MKAHCAVRGCGTEVLAERVFCSVHRNVLSRRYLQELESAWRSRNETYYAHLHYASKLLSGIEAINQAVRLEAEKSNKQWEAA